MRRGIPSQCSNCRGEVGGLNLLAHLNDPPSSGKFQPRRGGGAVAATPLSSYHFTANEWFASHYHTSTDNEHALHPICTVIWL